MTVPNTNPLGYLGLKERNPPNIAAKEPRNPTSADFRNFTVGDFWYNTVTKAFWILTNLLGSVATWEQFTQQPTGDMNTLSDDSGTLVFPTAPGNIQLSGSGSIQSVAGTNQLTYGLTGLTSHAVLVGAGTSTITKLSVGTTGQVLTGATGADPAFAALGTNAGLTAHGVVIAEGNSAFVATAAGTTGQLFVGATGADPAFASSANADFTFTSSTSGAARTLTVQNTSNTASSSAVYSAVVGGTSGGDPFYKVSNGTTLYSFGMKNSDSSFRLTSGSDLTAQTLFSLLESAGVGKINVAKFYQVAVGSTLVDPTGIYPTFSTSTFNASLPIGININNSVGVPATGCKTTLLFSGASATEGYAQILCSPSSTTNASLSALVLKSGTLTTALNLDSTGNVTKPASCAFNARLSASTASNVTGDGTTYTIICDDDNNADQNSNYNNGTGVFVAPVTAVYTFTASVQIGNIGAQSGVFCGILTTARLFLGANLSPAACKTAANSVNLPISLTVKLSAGDSVVLQVTASGGAKTIGVIGGTDGNTYFSGFLAA